MPPRIIRGIAPDKIRKKHIRDDALESLFRDFDKRCAYCMNREQEDEGFKIDHHFPTSKGGPHTHYENLFLSCDRCNHHKKDFWPSREENDRGVRFLNCCIEMDYGEHIFEKLDGNLISHSPQGKYHIRMLKLNRPDLVRLRLKRRELLEKIHATFRAENLNFTDNEIELLTRLSAELRERIVELIPFIPPLTEAQVAA